MIPSTWSKKKTKKKTAKKPVAKVTVEVEETTTVEEVVPADVGERVAEDND